MKPRCCATAATVCPPSRCPSGLYSAHPCPKRNAASSTAAHSRNDGGNRRKIDPIPPAHPPKTGLQHHTIKSGVLAWGPLSPFGGTSGVNRSPPRARQRMHPALHARLGVLDVLLGEKVFGPHLIDRIDRPQEVALVAERHRRIDAHAAF